MGFELYLQCFASGRPAGIPRAAVCALFPVVEEESEPDYSSIRSHEHMYDWRDFRGCRSHSG